MNYETIIWEQSGAVGRLTLNRPDSMNAWTAQLGTELRHVLEGDAANDSVRALLVTGAGRAFSSGADLRAGMRQAEDGMPDVRHELHEIYHPAIATVRRLAKPVVAAINGPAVGIGLSLALACDLVMAAESAFLSLAFANIGLMPDGGTTAFVPAAAGKARAFEMALLAERVPAPQALEWGLVNWVYPDDRLMAEADALAERLAGGTDTLVRGVEGGAQSLRLRGPRRATRGRGGAAACARAHAGLHRGRERVRAEAHAELQRRLAQEAT